MKRNIQLTSLKLFFLAFIGLTTFSVILIFAFTPGVMVNDDIAMMAFANGDFTGQPEFQLVFIGALIGSILKFLYTSSSALPWYSILFVLIQILSGSMLLTVVFNFLRKQLNRSFIAYIGLIAVFTPALVLNLSFSTTAMYTSVIGLTSLALVVQDYEKQGVVVTAAIGITLIVASSLRFEFLLAAGLLILPVHLVGIGKLTKPMALLTLGTLLLPLGTHFIENQVSNRDDWAEFTEFNELRGSMHGTPGFSQFVSTAYEDETIEKIREFGWESEDLRLFASWYFEDAERFSTTSLERLKENISSASASLPLQPSVEGIIYGREFLILVGLICVVFGAALSVLGFRNFALFQASWFVLIALLVSSRARFPDRFALAAIFGFFISLLASNIILAHRHSLSEDKFAFRTKKIETFVFLTLVFAIVFLIPHKFSAEQISIQNQSENTRLESEVAILDAIDSKGTFVHIGGLAIEGINPWFERTVFQGNKLLALGWNSQSPHQEKRKNAMGFKGNFLSNFVDEPNLYLVTTEDITKLLQHSFEKRQKSQIKFISLGNLTYVNVYQVLSTSVEMETTHRNLETDS